MTETDRSSVFAGGTSKENEVSRGSGAACALGLSLCSPFYDPPLRHNRPTRSRRAPRNPRAATSSSSTLHGTFGEDGGMQRLLDAAVRELSTAGCDAYSRAPSPWTRSRQRGRSHAKGVPVAEGVAFAFARLALKARRGRGGDAAWGPSSS